MAPVHAAVKAPSGCIRCRCCLPQLSMSGLVAGIKDSVNMKHIKMHYYTSHPKLNHYAVIPKGLEGTGKEWYGEPHNRARLPAEK